MVQGEVDRDSIEPCAEGRVGAKVREPLEGTQERGLREIHGIVVVADIPEDELLQAATMTLHQLIESSAISGSASDDERRVRVSRKRGVRGGAFGHLQRLAHL